MDTEQKEFTPPVAVWTPEQLERAGRLLFGTHWITGLADSLAMNKRNIEYMAKGKRPVHEGIARDILDVMKDRGEALAAACLDLEITD